MIYCGRWIEVRAEMSKLSSPEISEFLIELCDDDRLAGGRDDHLHVGLGLHLPLRLMAAAGGLQENAFNCGFSES